MNIHEQLRTAMGHHQAGRTAEAEGLYRQVLSQQPNSADALHLLGVLCAANGRGREGIELMRKAIALQPQTAGFYVNLARALLSEGNKGEAAEALKQAALLDPGNYEVQVQLAKTLSETGRPNEAAEAYRRAIALRPEVAENYDALSLVHIGVQNYAESLEALECLLALRPKLAQAWATRSWVLRHLGRAEEGVTSAQRAIEIDERCAEGHQYLALNLYELRRIDEALVAGRRAVELKLDCGATRNTLAFILKDDGQLEAAIDEIEKAIQLEPQNNIYLSNKIYTLEFDPRSTPQTLLAEQRRWNERLGEPLKRFIPRHENDPAPNRRLRVAYVSPYFCSHAESFFVVPLLEAHDPAQMEIHCYNDRARPDTITGRLKKSAHVWHDTFGINVEQLADRIYEDRIDIVVDLAMHMASNRALTFARKPAPLQFAWLAYPGGSGLDAIDYRFTDPWIDPPGSDETCYHEKSIRLPRTWVCFHPLVDVPPAAPRMAGPIRFGSLNNPCKLNEPLLELWANVMSSVPDSRLLVQAISVGHPRRIQDFFATRGISADRIEFAPRCPRRKYLRLYDQIDICLDPLPYNGITTSCDALWMGVPVVTLIGRTAASRAGASILQNVGLPELIAKTPEEFVEIATWLADDGKRLEDWRHNLRSRIESSPIMNARQFARDMEAAYRQAWIDWCGRPSGESAR